MRIHGIHDERWSPVGGGDVLKPAGLLSLVPWGAPGCVPRRNVRCRRNALGLWEGAPLHGKRR
eukprot:338466-Prymnesium_polylepis.1